mmetsp:Transcript_55197/g.129222  ORF Transcript_55197/g.129222 Transcript_55197/m.129222 type:complete len:558 (-) Transcript_55197:149-1822(-)
MRVTVARILTSTLLALVWTQLCLGARLSQQEAVRDENSAVRSALADEGMTEEDLALGTTHSDDLEDEEGDTESYTVKNPPLCAESLVADACKVMDVTDIDDHVSVDELAFVTSTSIESASAFYSSLGLAQDEPIPCQELCEAVIKSIPDDRRPPYSDVACRNGYNGEPKVVCDVDVSPEELSIYDFDENHTEFEDGHEEGTGIEDGTEVDDKPYSKDEVELLELTPAQLTVFVANRFRTYPKVDIEIDQDVGDVELENETDIEPPANESSLAEMRQGGYCSLAICRKLSDCSEFPLSCSGCKACGGASLSHPPISPSYSPSPSPTYYYNPAPSPYYHPAPSPYYYGPAPSPSYYYPSPTPAPTPSYYYPSPTPRPTSAPSPSPSPSAPSWLVDVEKVSVKAQAYVAKALQVAPKSDAFLKKWFGRSDKDTVKKVMYVLNSLSGMLGNVAYAKGPKCGPNTYAYVYPRGSLSKNAKGQFVFYLCSVYFRSDQGEKIETLTHEGSHHALAYTDDVWADAGHTRKAYGRRTCQMLAREYPDRAIVNADSHCYFINDVNEH